MEDWNEAKDGLGVGTWSVDMGSEWVARVGERSHGERGSDGEEDRELRMESAEMTSNAYKTKNHLWNSNVSRFRFLFL